MSARVSRRRKSQLSNAKNFVTATQVLKEDLSFAKTKRSLVPGKKVPGLLAR